MFIVYVIQSASGKRYTGHTSDLKHRLEEHNAGLCKSTKIDKEWLVLLAEELANRSEAMKREKWLKAGAGRQFVQKVLAGWSPP